LTVQQLSNRVLLGQDNWDNVTILVEEQLFEACDSVVTGGFIVWAAMVRNDPVIGAGYLENRVVSRTVSDLSVALEHFSMAHKWTKGRVRPGIGD
jgi:hypothetical protein